MPIKPENKKLYPKNWKQIREEILGRANDQCECGGECGHQHSGEIVDGDMRCEAPNRAWIMWEKYRHREETYRTWQMCNEWDFSAVRIVLTIAHLNHNPKDNRRGNLKAMCQCCHLRYDRWHHAENARKTRVRNLKRGVGPSATAHARRRFGS